MLQGKNKDLKILSDTRTQKDTLAVFGGEYPGGALYTKAEWIASHEKEVQGMTNAIVATLKWIHSHTPEEICRQDAAGIWSARTRRLYLAALKNTLPMYSETGRMDPKGAAGGARGVQPVVARRRQGQYRPVEDLHQQVRRRGQQEDGDEVSFCRARKSKGGITAGDFPAVSVIVEAMNILSIQSHVAYGHVGNSAAVFALQRLGVEVWPIHTVQFSNHTGYGKWQGRVFDAALIRELVGGIEQRGVLGECDGVLSGYMGGADIGAAILDAVATVKRANPAARYCCDPVIGDVGRGIFVREGIPEFMQRQGGAGRRYRHAQPV